MLKAIVEASPLAIITVDRARTIGTWNPSAERMFGVPANAAIGKSLTEAGSPQIAELFAKLIEAAPAAPIETTLKRNDGTTINVSIFPAPLRSADGEVYAVMGLLQNITDRKRLEQEREELLRRIVTSQEEERKRIARELHDELGQHLTALKVGLEALHPSDDDVGRMKQTVSDIDASVDRLTLELRRPALDDVGLQGAIISLTEQFTASTGIRADVHTKGTDGERLADEVEATLYRVLQEALMNVRKHAHAQNVSVIVECTANEVKLIVEDDGNGFDGDGDGDEATRDRFGILGMRERVTLIGGSFNIESAPQRGTAVYVRVPLNRPTA
jgi:PAS domain S-box-containing protein